MNEKNESDEMTAALLKYLDLLAGPAMDRFTWDLDFRAAVQGSIAADDRDDHSPEAHAEYGAAVADEMARMRAERRKGSKT